jgi:uncharacterized membrane protein
MNPRLALKIVFIISLIGVLFSGTLIYLELFGQTAVSCPAVGVPGTVFGYPACVYGFFIYAVLAVISFFGLIGSRERNKL